MYTNKTLNYLSTLCQANSISADCNFAYFNNNSYFNIFTGFNNFLPNFKFFNTDFSKIFTNVSWYNNLSSNFNFSNKILFNYSCPSLDKTDTFIKSTPNKSESNTLLLKLAENAKKYEYKVNSDSDGNRLFSGGKKQPWCTDFVSYNIEKVLGDKLPSSFKHFSSVTALKNWGENNDCYYKIPETKKEEYVAQNIKVGDIMIETKGNKSHTGIVTKVNADGSFETIEGNCGNKVATQCHKANSPTLSGFISLEKYIA